MSAALRIYIWEGNGISDAWHDDGTLVVLAESPEQARAVVREKIVERQSQEDDWTQRRDVLWQRMGVRERISIRDFWNTPEAKALGDYPYTSHIFDGTDDALDREPDRIVDIDGPKWVAFNGGGYD